MARNPSWKTYRNRWNQHARELQEKDNIREVDKSAEAISVAVQSVYADKKKTAKAQKAESTRTMPLSERIVCANWGHRLSWADSRKEKHGDYVRLASAPILPGKLGSNHAGGLGELEFTADCPERFKAHIKNDYEQVLASRYWSNLANAH